MEQQQEITYQYELFNQIGEGVIRPFVPSETVRGAQGDKGVAIKRSRRTGTSLNARFNGRFVQSHIKLREVEQLKECLFHSKSIPVFQSKSIPF